MLRVIALSVAAALAAAQCSCSNPSYCKPLPPTPGRKEVYSFSTTTDDSWKSYPWNSNLLTTVCLFQGIPDPDIICTAHQNNVKLTFSTAYPQEQLHNTTYLNWWIGQQIEYAKEWAFDGFNHDIEWPVTTPTDAAALTYIMNQTVIQMKAAISHDFQVTADLAWSAKGIDRRFYDYAAIAEVMDLVIIMSYDLRSQVWPPAPCIAGSNDALPDVEAGVQSYLNLGINASKMLLGSPFYGFSYPCLGKVSPTASYCPIQEVPYEGAPCSDAAGDPIGFDSIMLLLQQSTTGYKYNTTTDTPWFNYVDESGVVHQVVYDDADSLTLKYKYARSIGLAGLSHWNIDYLDWTSSDPVVKNQTATMWNALEAFCQGEC